MSFEVLANNLIEECTVEMATKKYLDEVGDAAFCDYCHASREKTLWIISGRYYHYKKQMVGILCGKCQSDFSQEQMIKAFIAEEKEVQK